MGFIAMSATTQPEGRSRASLGKRVMASILAASLCGEPGLVLAQGKAASQAQDTVTLNFVDADIVAATQAIGKFLRKDFLIDPRVKGTVTITTDHAVTRAEAYRLLLGALRFQGYTIVDVDGINKVLPEADAKFAGGNTTVGRAGRGDEIETEVFRLNYESANNLLTTLRPLITANNPITVNASNNSVVVTDYADNLRRIAKLIAAIDVPSSSDADVVPLKFGIATDLAPILQKMLDSPQGTNPDAGQRVLVVAEPRTNSLLLRAASPARLALARQLIAKLDIGTSAAGNIHMVYLKNAEASKLAATLRAVVTQDANAQLNASTPALTPPTSSGGGTGSSSGSSTGSALNTLTSALGGSGSSTLGGGSGSGGNALSQNPFGSNSSTSSGSGGGGFIQADPQTNALIITAPEAVFRNLLPIIEKLDVRRAQVFVESLIVEVTSDKAAQFGIQWQGLTGYGSSGTNVVGGTNFNGTGTGTNILGIAQNPSTVGTGLNIGIVHGSVTIPGIGTITNLGFLAQALESDTNTNILSTPNLLTLDNEEASIIVGQTVPFITGSYASTGTTSTVTPFQTVEEKDIGLSLKIKPQIADNGTIKLQIYQEDSSIQSTTTQGYIITNKRAVSTNVQVDDGQIIVLGGLVQDSVQDTNEQVPLLGDLPWVGNLFRYRTKSRNKTDLMIFLRPYVVREPGDSRVSDSKYDAMQRREREVQPPHDNLLPDMVAPVLPDRPAAGGPQPAKLPEPGSSDDMLPPVMLPPNPSVRIEAGPHSGDAAP
jgi:general secretion pathway protein D